MARIDFNRNQARGKMGKVYKKLLKDNLLVALLKFKFLNIAYPLFISWRLTTRCNLHCANCHVWKISGRELNTSEVCNIIDKLYSRGTRYISFTGGEPLLRDDIGRILDHSSERGLINSLNTNGILLKDKIDCLRSISRLNLSLDGPEGINDALRGKGAFKSTITAVEIAKNKNVPVSLTTVISKLNSDFKYIDFLLALAKDYKIEIGFQPASLCCLGSREINHLSPIERTYKEIIAYLINKKLSGNRFILNSIANLKHLYSFPEERKLSCLAGKIMFRMETNGSMYACGWGLNKERQRVRKLEHLENNSDSEVSQCRSCWTHSAVELNLIGSLDVGSFISAIRRFMGICYKSCEV